MPLYHSKMLRVKEHAPTTYFSVGFSLDSRLNPSKNWEFINLFGIYLFFGCKMVFTNVSTFYLT
jgi:hypothetical protein